MRAVLYARVSTKGQEDGYSIRQQFEALREHCRTHGIEVVAEVYDVYTGYSIERPGLGEMLDIIAGTHVDLVLAQDRDRFGRGDIVSVLKFEFNRKGVKLLALNDPDEEDPYGQFIATVMDGSAALERAVTTIRTMRNRKKRAQEGKVIGSCPPPFGYQYNADRTNFEIDPLTMPTTRRIFELVAAGTGICTVCKIFNDEGIPTVGNYVKKGKQWYPNTIRRIIFNDSYKGVWTFGRRRIKLTPDGQHKRSVKLTDPSEHVHVPIPPSGIPDELIDKARAAIQGQYKPRPTSDRYFELARLLYCGECGQRMSHYNGGFSSDGKRYSYYVCYYRRKKLVPPKNEYEDFTPTEVCAGPSLNADRIEAAVMVHADEMLQSPERLNQHFDETIESVPASFTDSAPWIQEINECDRKIELLLEDRLNDRFPESVIDRKLTELENVRTAAQSQLNAASESGARVDQLEKDRKALLRAFGDGMQRGLAEFTPEGRRAIYEALNLRITVASDGVLWFNARWDNDVMKLAGMHSNLSLTVPLSG